MMKRTIDWYQVDNVWRVVLLEDGVEVTGITVYNFEDVEAVENEWTTFGWIYRISPTNTGTRI